ncbi:MAG: hypothetical protein HY537_07205 [Deltaproteobacteria bacterium]|nr:hypothetical protein [Deltaproteobacteria bacterium]
MEATEILHQKAVLKHQHDEDRLVIFEIIVWRVGVSSNYPDGIKYRAWLSEGGQTLFGFDNHKPKGAHLHVHDVEIGYVYRGLDALKADIVAMIQQEGFIYEK